MYYANEEMADMLGYDSAEEMYEAACGKAINIIPPEDLEQVFKSFGDSYYEGMRYETAYRMFETIPGGIILGKLDKNHTIKMVSEHLAQMLGYESSEKLIRMSGGSVAGLAAADNLVDEVKHAGKVLSSENMYTLHYPMRCKNGSVKNIEEKGKRIRNEKGEYELWSFISDRDEIIKKAEALDEAQNMNKNFLDFVNCGVISYRLPDHKIFRMNAEARRIFGMIGNEEIEDVMREVLSNAVYWDLSVPERLKSLRTEDGAVDYQCTLINHLGEEIHIVARTVLFSMLSGERRIITTFLDISENLALKNEKNILDTLCGDYTSAYMCNLDEDSVVPVNAATIMEECVAEEKIGPEIRKFSAKMQYIYNHMIIQDAAEDFLEKMNAEYLKEYLREHKKLVYRLRSSGNDFGYEHFELQLIRLDSESGFKVILGIRNIDNVIKEEERQKRLLRDALEASNRKNRIIKAISKQYLQVFSINLKTDSYREVFSFGNFNIESPEHIGKASSLFLQSVGDFADKEYTEELEKIADYNTLTERLANRDTVYADYRSDGEWMSARYIVQERDEEGNVEQILFLLKKTDEQKRKELEYKKKLEETAKEAKLANEAKTNFLRRMSHDMRTPLNGIIGLLKIDEKHFDDAKLIKHNHEKMAVSANYLLSLINDVLQTSKIENGSAILTHERVNFAELTRNIVNIIITRATEAGIKWEYESSEAEVSYPYIYGSPVHLRQIFLNFYGNCIKYNKPGGTVRTVVRAKETSPGVCTYHWVISDTGIGMSKEFLGRIFEPFSQENSNVQTSYQGVGLGMSIVKGLVDKMGGTINVTSEKGVGTTFDITLSFEIAPTSDDDCCEISQENYDISGMSFLLVEDNELNAEIAISLLKDEGASVVAAKNGKIAVDMFTESEEGTFNAILMDMMMPVMDGITATKMIRSSKRADAETIPIIAMTANAFKEDEIKCIEAGMNVHIAKPLDMDKVKNTVCRYVHKLRT